ncbi:carboxypeptidase regulatory-like domain-containing protein [Aliinostoc sp. HNIBRCY26]|uniref:carboxypeptidase regulatory-like domain-containing protein n=1 Tax=Aliinostoc sp. HNIBRCY26 TaxID=3418997 RepID=UPI003D0424C8
MFYQTPTSPPTNTVLQSENISCPTSLDHSDVSGEQKVSVEALAQPSAPESIGVAEFSPLDSLPLCDKKVNSVVNNLSVQSSNESNKEIVSHQDQINSSLVSQHIAESTSDNAINNIADTGEASKKYSEIDVKGVVNRNETSVILPESNENNTNIITQQSVDINGIITDSPETENTVNQTKGLLLGVIVNEREVGTLDVVQENDVLLIPLLEFAKIAGFTVEAVGEKTQLNTPLGTVSLANNEIKTINGIAYVDTTFLKEKLATNIELNSADSSLVVNFPWRRNAGTREQTAELQPEVRPPSSGLSNLRQELSFNDYSGSTSWRSSTLLGGRLDGGAWRARLENDFVNQPNLTEYFFYKRSGRFLYQLGRQQIGLHPLVNGVNLTGVQFGYTNLPQDRFNPSYSASELLPRRSRPLQTFRGTVPPASFVQLRVSSVIVAQQQVGLSGEYEFTDVNLPPNQANDIELLVFDRNNPNVPIEIRQLSFNVSDLFLPSGGNVQLTGFGLTGNLIQNSLFDDFNNTDAGKFTAFYQLRQGLSNNFTVEGLVQTLPDTTQVQAGFAWRLAPPAILAANVGTSRGGVGYTTDLSIQLNQLEITGNSELFPVGYLYTDQSRDRFNHSLELKYKFSNDFNLGAIARSYQDQTNSSEYISPTFYLRPFSGLSFRGRPDVQGRYLFNALYQLNPSSRLSFNTFGDIYTTDFSYNLSRNNLLSLGGEFGGDLANRYTVTLNHNARTLSALSWRLGLAYSDGDVGPIIGANMQVLPGLFARVDYQGIPSRTRNFFGGIGDERLTISLVSDLSFAGGRLTPANYISISQERGAIAGRIVVDGGKQNLDLGGSIIRVFNSRNQNIGRAKTDSQGNFFVGNLSEGVYIVEIDPEQLPVELSLKKTSVVAEVAGAAVTQLDFPVRLEYGIAGKITDVSGQPMSEVEIEVVDAEGKRVTTGTTDQFGLYRVDGLPVGKYTIRIPEQANITNNETLPQLEVAISKDFIYDQNLQLPVAAAVKQIAE